MAEQGQRGLTVAVGAGQGDPPGVGFVEPVLAARDAQGTGSLEASVGGADVLHLHNVMNPDVLAWAARLDAVITVQDHRVFCPGMGKWTRDGQVCTEPMSPAACATCFGDPAYFEGILSLTQARLAALRQFRRVVVLSRYMQEQLALVGVPSVVIPPFVHGLPAQAPPSPELCVSAGRLVRAKGHNDVIRAWELAEVERPLVFLGTGPERGALERQGFQVTGWLDRGELSAWFSRAAMLIMAPRWQEPFGIVGLEALHLGVPVAAWNSGGIGEWHPGPVAYGDHEALAQQIRNPGNAHVPRGFEAGVLMDRLAELYVA